MSRWRTLGAFLGIVILASACGGGPASSGGSTASGQPAASRQPPATFAETDVQQAITDLASIGVDVRARPGDAAPLIAPDGEGSAVHLLRLQVRAMALERAAGGGLSGARLDQGTTGGGGGALSSLIAGWAEEGATPAATYAATLIRPSSDGNVLRTAFPKLAMVAFLADVTRGSTGISRGSGNLLAVSSAAFCGELSAYVGDALNGIYSLSGDIPPWLQNLIVAYAPQYANEPDLFRHTIGALGLLVYATTLAKPWTIQLQADPGETRYGVEGVDSDPVGGEVDLTVLADPGYGDEVADCADLAAVNLGSVSSDGADVVWVTSTIAPHATATVGTATVDDVGQASINYETATECKEAAQGSTVTDVISIGALVDRQELKDLRDAAEKILLGDAYGTPLGTAAATAYQSMKPLLDAAALPSGFVNIDVVHHDGPCGSSPPGASGGPGPSGTPGTDCATMLPADEVEAATGVSIGVPTTAGDVSVFPIACVWEDVEWSLQGNGPFDPPISRYVGQFAGVPCERSGGDSSLIYCLNLSQDAVGGLVYTSRWGFILTTAGLSIDEVESDILPILDRHGN